MDNMKRCDWCCKEYEGPGIHRLTPDNKSVVCSIECLDEIYQDEYEDQKLKRIMKDR